MSGLVIDAAYPPAAVPAGISGVMGYVGGNALHTWTPEQWQPFHGVRQYPCWVAELGGNAAAQALEAVKAVERLGWAAHEPASQNRVIVCDLEMAVDAVWYATWSGTVTGSGFTSVAYGSLSTVLRNDAADVLAADWDGVARLPAGATIHGVQYEANVQLGGALVDRCLFDSWLMARGGVGPRHGA